MSAGNNSAVLILAAGKGTRMGGERPKAMQTLLGQSMLEYVIAALRPVFNQNIYIVVGYQAQMIMNAYPEENFIFQAAQQGTGHALQCALPELEKHGYANILIVNADAPLITTAIIENFISSATHADLAFMTINLADPGSYGRVLRKGGEIAAIVEAKDYNPSLLGEPSGEINAGIYWLRLLEIKPLLGELDNQNNSEEYYLTDLVGAAVKADLSVAGIAAGDNSALLGINNPAELADMEDFLAQSIVKEHLKNGVIIHNPKSARIGPRTKIEPGAEIHGPCEIYGECHISASVRINAFCVLKDCEIEPGATIQSFCHIEQTHIGPLCIVGPYARLRPGAVLGECAHVGNFVELKKTSLGSGAKANHLSYLGDAEIGSNVNIGAGTITCNYDGQNKYKTKIEAEAFIGSNTALVAPVTVGARALVGAGSVITKNVPCDELAIARARQINMPRRQK